MTAVLAVIVAGVLVRAGVMIPARGRFDDPDNYLPLARSLAEGRGLIVRDRATAYRPPLYPIVLAPLVGGMGERVMPAIALLHLVLGAGTIGLTAWAASRWNPGRYRVLAASCLVAFDPVLVWQARFVMTETLTAFLLAATLAALTIEGRRGFALGGACAGLSALARPSLLPGTMLAVVAALFAAPGNRKERVRGAVLLAFSVLLVILPWALRNAKVLGEPVWTTTHGGYTLALANNEVYYREVLEGPPGRVWTGDEQWRWWDSVNRATAGMSEPEADRYLRRQAVRLAIDQPTTFLRASVERLLRFWSLSPAIAVYSPVVRWATALWTAPVWLAMALGLLQRSTWRWPRIVAPLAIVGLSLVHALYWTDLRMRAPIVPAIALVAAMATVAIPSRLLPRVPGLPAAPNLPSETNPRDGG
jgi:hypothetical protein